MGFTGSPTNGTYSLEVEFILDEAIMGLEALTFAWDFGDGEISSLRNPKHTYPMPGVYTVGLTVLFNDGSTIITIRIDYIKVWDYDYSGDNPNASITTKCYRLPIDVQDGFGISEYKDSDNPGFDWVWPCTLNGTAYCLDENKEEIALVLDTKTQQVYQINDPNVWKDRMSEYATSGIDITGEVHFRADHGELGEHVAIKTTESHAYFDPYDRDKRNTLGFDAVGFMTGMAVDLQWMKNGEPVTPVIEAKTVPMDGDLVGDSQIEGRTLQARLKMHAAGYWLKGFRPVYETIDKAATPSLRLMTETVNQENLTSMPLFHVGRNYNPLLNLATAADATGTISSAITGPDQTDYSAIRFAAPNFGMNDTSPESLSGDFTLKCWLNNVGLPITVWNIGILQITLIAGVSLQINDGTNPVITYPLTFGNTDWTLLTIVRSGVDIICYENYTLLGRTGVTVIDYGTAIAVVDDAASDIADPIALPRALTEAEILYYYVDITQKQGLSVLPTM